MKTKGYNNLKKKRSKTRSKKSSNSYKSKTNSRTPQSNKNDFRNRKKEARTQKYEIKKKLEGQNSARNAMKAGAVVTTADTVKHISRDNKEARIKEAEARLQESKAQQAKWDSLMGNIIQGGEK